MKIGRKKYDTQQQKFDMGDYPPVCETIDKRLQEKELLTQTPKDVNQNNNYRKGVVEQLPSYELMTPK